MNQARALREKKQARILVVDDEPTIQRLVSRILIGSGYRARTVESGEKALQCMAEEHFDVVISDIAMPGLTGIELARRIVNTYGVDVILMTGKVDEFKYHDLIPMGVADFIQKPFTSEEVILRVDRILRERRIKEELDSLRDEYTHAQKLEAIGQLSAGIAHEINTPIQYIADNTRFIKDGYQGLDSLIRQFLNLFEAAKSRQVDDKMLAETESVMEQVDVAFLKDEFPAAIEQTLEGVDRISRIVKAIKTFSHPGDQTHKPVDLNKHIETAVVISKNEWKYTADLILDLDPGLPEVCCDPGQMNQVLLNLIINASHAVSERLPPGSGEKGRIEVASKGSADWVEISVRDNGAGISEDIRARIFDPFFTTKPAGKGTGQGLAIARNIVENRHGGRLNCPAETRGARFVIQIPVK